MKIFQKFILLFSLILPPGLICQNLSSPLKFTALDRDAGAHFGSSVAVHGIHAIIGSYNAHDTDFTSLSYGSAHFFRKLNDVEWEEVNVVYPPSGNKSYDMEFGFNVDIFNNFAVVAARKYSSSLLYEGAVFVYKRQNNGIWTLFQTLKASDAKASSQFGYSLAISNNRIIVGAPYADKDSNSTTVRYDCGRVYVYKLNTAGTSFVEESKLTSLNEQTSELFGISVDMDGDLIIVGAKGRDDPSNALVSTGAAFIFRRAAAWNLEQKIWPAVRADIDDFGYSVAIQNNIALVGAIGEDHNENNASFISSAGAVYAFEYSASVWTESFKFLSSLRNLSDNFGNAVALDDDIAVISCKNDGRDENNMNFIQESGAAFVFKRITPNNWKMVKKLVAPVREFDDEFAWSIAIDSMSIMVGAWNEDHDKNEVNSISNAGSIFVIRECLVTLDSTVIVQGDSLYAAQDDVLYQWWNCDSNILISGEINRTFRPAFSGNYAVIMNNYGCMDTSSCSDFSLIVPGVDENSANPSFEIWPNPAEDVLFIRQENSTGQIATFEIFNVKGQSVMKAVLTSKQEVLNLSHLSPSLYLLSLTSGNHRETYKLMVK